MISGVSQKEVTELVKKVLIGANLSKITGKMVRLRVVEMLGSRAGSDKQAIKQSVKAALTVVLSSQSETGDLNECASPEQRADTEARKPHEVSTVRPAPGMANRDVTKDAAQKRASDESPSKHTDSEFHFDEESDKGAPSRVKPSSKRTRKIADLDSESDSEFPESAHRKRNATTMVPKRRRIANNAAATKRFNRLKKLCRQIGCPVPPNVFKCDDYEKRCEYLEKNLRSKGLHAANPLKLTVSEISSHRQRIEREKELAGIDVSNIIGDGGRSKRAVAKSSKPISDHLPSDLSGEELSDGPESDESEGYAAPSQQSE